MEHGDGTADLDINWDDVRVFLLVARLSSFRAASIESGVSVNALRRRIEALEHKINAVLLTRSAKGVELTEEGRKVEETAQAMLEQARALARLSSKSKRGLRATVRVGATEGLGAFWLVPRLVDLFERAPGIQVDFRNEMRVPDVSGLEVDIAVQLERPADEGLKVVRLGWLHIVLFASADYISRHGIIETSQDIPRHRFIEINAPQIQSGALKEELPEDDSRSFVALRVNTASAQVLAATHGAGVTALPTYAQLVTHKLHHVAREFSLKRDIWLCYHPDIVEFRHMRQAIDWIKSSFDQEKYPWFGERFLSPDEIDHLAAKRGLGALFFGFRDEHKL